MSEMRNPDLSMQTFELQQERRRALTSAVGAVLLLLVNLVAFAYMVIITSQTRFWQVFTMAGVFAAAVVLCGAAIVLSRRGRTTQAVGTLIFVVISATLVIALLTSATGLAVGVIGGVAILALAIQTLPQRWTNRTLILVVVAVMASGLLEFYSPYSRDIPGFRNLFILTCAAGLGFFSIYLVFRFRSLSMTNKFIVAFLMVTLVVSGGVIYYTQQSTTRALTERVGNELNSQAIADGRTVGDLLERQIAILQSLSIDNLIVEQVKTSNQHYIINGINIQQEILSFDKQWIAAIAANNISDPLVKARLQNPASLDLKKFNSNFPDNVETFITDYYGALVATSNPTSDYNQGDESWWQFAFHGGVGAVYVGSPERDASTGKISINIALPVRENRTGALLGILRTTYQLSALNSVLLSGNLGKTGRADLYFPGQPIKVASLGELQPADPATVVKLMAVAKQPFSQIILDGSPVLNSQTPVQSTGKDPTITNLGWTVSVSQAVDEALAPVTEQARTTFLFVGAIVGLVVFGAILLAEYMAAPVVRLTEAAERIRAGDLSAQAAVTTSDEIGRLAQTFNQMTSQLRQTLTGLEQRVTERTRELTLSGEVGRSLSQERDLDRLLKDAVERVQTAFDLYYTQIYLLDATGQFLVLRSGTGAVGVELLNRRHRLQIGSGSINGSAAARKEPVIVADTTASNIFRANPLLPDTRSEMAVPLLVGERVVGVLDMQSNRPGALSEDNLAAFQSLAAQLAIAIDNAALFAQAQEARLELEGQARRLTRRGWQDFLDAIQHSEHIGFSYDSAGIQEMSASVQEEVPGNPLGAVLEVGGEPIGSLQLDRDAEKPWTQADRAMVTAVAAQIVRQIDNLRLLAQAETYRNVAEEAARRLTRTGWENLLEQQPGKEVAFVYDQNRVLPETALPQNRRDPAFSLPLRVQGETIGELAVAGASALDEESQELMRGVAERLSAHIESLRLSTQTETALLETETLYGIIAKMNAAASYNDILSALSERTLLSQASRLVLLAVFDKPLGGAQMPEWIYPLASRAGADLEIAARYPLSAFEAVPHTLFTGNPAVLSSLATDQRLDRVTRTLFKEVFQAQSSIIIPLMLGDQSIGFVQGYFSEAMDFPETEVQRLTAVAGQAAIAVQSRLLLEQAQSRARQEQRIREVTSQVFDAADVDTIMRRAVEQVGRVLGMPAYIYLGDPHAKDESPNGATPPASERPASERPDMQPQVDPLPVEA